MMWIHVACGYVRVHGVNKLFFSQYIAGNFLAI